MNILFVGPLAGGKTEIINELIAQDFAKESDYHSIEKTRRQYSSGSYAGEMFAWAHFLEAVEQPASKVNNLYEFSGTGRNVWNVSETIRNTFEQDEKWLVIYVLAEKKVLVERATAKTYDAPCPYELTNINESVDYMNSDLKKTLAKSHSWASVPKIIIRTDLNTKEECVTKVLEAVSIINQ